MGFCQNEMRKIQSVRDGNGSLFNVLCCKILKRKHPLQCNRSYGHIHMLIQLSNTQAAIEAVFQDSHFFLLATPFFQSEPQIWELLSHVFAVPVDCTSIFCFQMKALTQRSHLNILLQVGYPQFRANFPKKCQQLEAQLENGVAKKNVLNIIESKLRYLQKTLFWAKFGPK